MTVCPQFFTDAKSQRVIGGDEDKAAWCDNADEKKLGDFETGGAPLSYHELKYLLDIEHATDQPNFTGSILLDEITHAESFSAAATGTFPFTNQHKSTLTPLENFFMNYCNIDNIDV